MSKITDEDVIASVLAYGKASSSGCRSEQLSVAGMRAAAEEIQRRVLARVKVELRPIHEPVSDDEAQAMLAAGQGYITAMKQIKTSGNALLARRAAPELKPMHEPVTSVELEAMMNEIHYGTAGGWFENVRAAGNKLLARRAAATRAEVVVTEEMVRQCQKDVLVGSSQPQIERDIVESSLNWLAYRLNGKHAAPKDPRVEIVRDWAQSYSIEPDDEPISELLAKLGARKP